MVSDLYNHTICNNLVLFSLLSLHFHLLLVSSWNSAVLIPVPCGEISDVSAILNFSAFVRSWYHQHPKKRNHQNQKNCRSWDHFLKHHSFFQKHDFHQTKLFAFHSASAGLEGPLGGLQRMSYVRIWDDLKYNIEILVLTRPQQDVRGRLTCR